jgi:hypothetical protein
MHGLFVGRGRAVLAKRFEIELGNKEVCIERENPNIFRQEPILDQVFIRYDEQSQNVFFHGVPPGNALEAEVESAVLNIGCWARGIGEHDGA